MSDWRDRIRTAGAKTPSSQDSNKFLDVLKTFVSDLSVSPWLHADLEQSFPTQGYAFAIRPKYRRDMRSIMVHFWIGPRSVSVAAADQRQEFSDVAQLEEYLVNFVESPQFQNTIAIYASIQKEHVTGYLRKKALFTGTPADVVLLVDASSHNALARACEENRHDHAAEVSAELVQNVDEVSDGYAYLESGGYGLKLAPGGLRRVGASIVKIHGDVVPVEDLAKPQPDISIVHRG